jgi:1-acyl-sn-glycerol-3-phosphate acyltransferase
VYFLAKEELFTTFKPFGWLIRNLNAVPLKREASALSAFRTGLSILEAGKVLLVFPEGTRNKTKETLLPLKDGASLLSMKSGVSLVPVYLGDTRGKLWRWLLRLRRPTIRFGNPLRPKDYPRGSQGVRRLTEDLKEALLDLDREEQRG